MATQHAAHRSSPNVETFIRPVIRSFERFAWAQAIFLCSVAVATCVAVMGRDIASNLDAAWVVVFFFGVAPGWLLSRLVLNDALLASDLARYGSVSRGRLVGVRRPFRFFLTEFWLARRRWWSPALWARTQLVRVEWIEKGARRQGEAMLDAAWNAPPDAEDIVVLTCPGMKRIGVVLGNHQMVVGTLVRR